MTDISKAGSRPHVEQREMGELSRLPRELLEREVLFHVACDGGKDLYNFASTCREARRAVVGATAALIARHDALEKTLVRKAGFFTSPLRAIPFGLDSAAKSAREFRQRLLPPNFYARVQKYLHGDVIAPIDFQLTYAKTDNETRDWSEAEQQEISFIIDNLRSHCQYQPDHFLGHYHLSFLLIALKREADLGTALTRANILSPRHPGVLFLHGLLALRSTEAVEAIAWFKSAVEANSGEYSLEAPAALIWDQESFDIGDFYVVALMRAHKKDNTVTRFADPARYYLDGIADKISYATALEVGTFLVQYRHPEAYSLLTNCWNQFFCECFDDGLFQYKSPRSSQSIQEDESDFDDEITVIAGKVMRLRVAAALHVGLHDEAAVLFTNLLRWRVDDGSLEAALAEL